MYGNLLVALSSFVFIFPLKYASENGDKVTGLSIFSVLAFSFFSHLIENHKNKMEGIPGVPEKASRLYNWLDRLGVLFVTSRFLFLLYENYDLVIFDAEDIFLACITMLLGWVSEFQLDVTPWKHHIPLHCMWHSMVAYCMMCALEMIYLC